MFQAQQGQESGPSDGCFPAKVQNEGAGRRPTRGSKCEGSAPCVSGRRLARELSEAPCQRVPINSRRDTTSRPGEHFQELRGQETGGIFSVSSLAEGRDFRERKDTKRSEYLTCQCFKCGQSEGLLYQNLLVKNGDTRVPLYSYI